MPEMEKKEALQSILRWTSETQVEYTPEGKRPGTASYERYEKYSKAKTVDEALSLGSKPVDLVNDFQKRILKVTGGVLREKPLEASEEASTETDRALIRFARSLNRDTITASQPCADGTHLGQADVEPDKPDDPAESAGNVKRLVKGKKVAKSTKAAKAPTGTELALKHGRVASHKKCRGGLLARMASHAKMAAKPTSATGPAMNLAVSAIRSYSVIQGGLLARVMAKRGLNDLGELGKAPPPVRVKQSRGPQGRFLSKVKLQRRTSDSGNKDPEAEANDKAMSTTPVKKKARKEPLAQTTEKEPTPRSRLFFPPPSAPEKNKLNCLQREPTHSCHLLALASTLSLSTKDPVATTSLLANFFQSIAQGTQNSEEVICAAIRILDPVTPVPPEVLAAVVKEAFGFAATVAKDEDALAEAALEGRRTVGSTKRSPRLLLTEVARAAEERDAAQLVGLVTASRAEAGESYWLIRLLQGRSGIARDTLHSAIARALISVQ